MAFAALRRLSGLNRYTLCYRVATRALNAGVPLRALCYIGGWQSPKVLLEIYTQTKESDASVAAARFLGLDW